MRGMNIIYGMHDIDRSSVGSAAGGADISTAPVIS